MGDNFSVLKSDAKSAALVVVGAVLIIFGYEQLMSFIQGRAQAAARDEIVEQLKPINASLTEIKVDTAVTRKVIEEHLLVDRPK